MQVPPVPLASSRLDDAALDMLFRQARSHNGWLARPVDDALIEEIYDLMKLGPTSVNGSPARILFLRSAQARERLLPMVSPGNVDKVRAAPVVAVIGYDTRFHELLPQLFPHNPGSAALFADNAALAEATAFRNGSLQGAYLMLAARALGLDCGPLSGFDAAQVNRVFFPDGRVKVNFLCCLGYGDHEKIFPRSPRLGFGQACTLL
ncbi:MAG: malonic semialdehyde reductase [Pseudomonadota bacterium]